MADCSYNGQCRTGKCECFPQWRGSHCAQLNTIPGTRQQGLHSYVSGERVSTWGGGAIKGPNGQYHMIASEMSEYCGINLWLSNSIIVHAKSSTFNGTYNRTYNAIIEDLFSHEPNFVFAPNTKEYVIFYTHLDPPPTFKYPCTSCMYSVCLHFNNDKTC